MCQRLWAQMTANSGKFAFVIAEHRLDHKMRDVQLLKTRSKVRIRPVSPVIPPPGCVPIDRKADGRDGMGGA